MPDFVLGEKELQQLKKLELDMLKECISICERLGLCYYLVEGTLLGAVRHQGFIPWDDDIDIAMKRDDYEVFIKEAPKYLSGHLFLQTNQSDSEALMNYAKIRNSNTTFLETSVQHRKMHHGVYIDIFPLDRFTDSKWKEKIFWFQKHWLRVKVENGFCRNLSQKQPLRNKVVNKALDLLLFWVTPKKALKIRERMYTAYKKGSRLASHSSPWETREIIPEAWYGDGVFLEFEGITVRCPKEYDKWLTQVYGDYRQLPPPEQRISHHFAEVIDLEKSYQNYI